MVDRYYVYKHLEGEEIVYIGMGQNGRAWTTHPRQKKHKEWMKDKEDPFEFVQCVRTRLSKKEAADLEYDLIQLHKPKYNTAMTTGSKSNNCKLSKEEVVYIRETLYKKEGKTQKEIANLYNTSQGYVSNVITGRLWNHI